MPETHLPPVDITSTQSLLPAVGLIEDTETYREVCDVVKNHAPEYFWTAPAASTYRHHNPYCCGRRGLWIHTLMVATAYERLAETYLAQGRISEYERDLGRAAVLLHDIRKYGDEYEPGGSAAKDHDVQAADLVWHETTLDDRVGHAIESHMGSPEWGYAGPAPETPLDRLVHQADMAASSKNGTWGIYRKPTEISELYPSLPEAELNG